MLTLNEGMPRSGKSYDAIKNHVLPALRQGREVHARLNFQPDSHERIAAYLGLDVAEVRKLLHVVDSKDVLPTFVCTQDESGEYVLPEKFHNCLIIIDECHEFYVSSKMPLPKEQHTFFAMHGHYGADILLMSQSFKDCHSGIRRRVERKTCFQKLSALGMDGRYLATYYNSVAPEKYEKTESITNKYEPEFFPLYKGFKDGAKTKVYEGGRRSLAQGLAVPALLCALVVSGCGWFLWHFFHKASPLVAKPVPAHVAAKVAENMQPVSQVRASAKRQAQKVREQADAELAKLTPEQRYVVDLSQRGRPRLAASIAHGDRTGVLIEWRDGGNVVADRLSTKQLEALGVTVQVEPYGVLLVAGDQRMVVTSWPVTGVVRDHEATLYQIGGAPSGGFAPPVAAGPVAGPAAGASGPRIGDNQQPIALGPAG